MWIYFSDSFGGNCRASTRANRMKAFVFRARVASGVRSTVICKGPTNRWIATRGKKWIARNFPRISVHLFTMKFLDSLRSKGPPPSFFSPLRQFRQSFKLFYDLQLCGFSSATTVNNFAHFKHLLLTQTACRSVFWFSVSNAHWVLWPIFTCVNFL